MLRLWRRGWTLDELALENERLTGCKPSRTAVSVRLRDAGVMLQRGSRRDLLPWDIRPEHRHSRFRVMLSAESKRREMEATGDDTGWSDAYDKAIDLLYDLLYGRGTKLVVGYHPEIGFYLTDRLPSDTDIIRAPHAATA
jgi:2-aminoadipate transaminase